MQWGWHRVKGLKQSLQRDDGVYTICAEAIGNTITYSLFQEVGDVSRIIAMVRNVPWRDMEKHEAAIERLQERCRGK